MAKFSPVAVRAIAGKATVASLNKQSGVIGKAGKALNDMIHEHAMNIMVFIHDKGAGNRTPATMLVQNIHSKSMKLALVKWFVTYAGCAWDEDKQALTGTKKSGDKIKFELTDDAIAEAFANPFWKDKDNATDGVKITILNEQDMIAALYIKLKERQNEGLKAKSNANGDEIADLITDKTLDTLLKLLDKDHSKKVAEKFKAADNSNEKAEKPAEVAPRKRKEAVAA